jgi:prolyl oligopeptidase
VVVNMEKNGMMQELKCKTKCIWWFHCCAELVQKYTSSDFLAIRGGSNGGLLVGATMTASRIDESRFAGSGSDGHVALPYFYRRRRLGMIMEQHKTVKCLNTSRIFSVHNVKKGTHYPATMVTTGSRW